MRSRQLTATQGLDGTKWYFGSLVITVRRSSLRKLRLHLIRHNSAAKPGAKYHDMCHVGSLPRIRRKA